MTRKRSSPLGLELVVSAMLIFMLLPLLTQAAPLQDATEIQQYTEGCYYNYNHYNEGDRILTNEPCLNCTCHNKMLMCYLRVCPFTKPIGHDCTVEKREDQCCPIITCPEVPVDIAHHAPEPGTELSIPEKYGCSIEEKFYPEGAQVPSNPNKPCELCYCIKNRTSCLMQECTLHIDGCQPIYNKGSCCPVRYNCDHENDVLELEDHSTSTTTTVRPTPGFVLTTTMSSAVSTDCIHNGERHADGSSITGKSSCEHCYCMRGDIVCAVQECDMPMLDRNGKSCRPLPASEGQCCPSNYVCEDDSATTQIIEVTTQAFIKEQAEFTTTSAPEKDLHGTVSQEDIKLQEHIDEDAQLSTEEPEKDDEIKAVADDEIGSGDFGTEAEIAVDHTTVSAVTVGVVDKKHEVLPADTTLEPFIKIEDKIDQATESGTALDQTTVSAGNADEKTVFAVDHTTVPIDTTDEADKKHEEPAVSMDHTTESADTTGKFDKKDEEVMDHTTLPAAITGDLDKKHEEPAIALDHTTVSADRIGETDKSDEEVAIDLDQTTVSADTTGKVDTKKEPTLIVPTDTTEDVDKKDEELASDLDHTTISSDTVGAVDTKHEEPAHTVPTDTTGQVDKKDDATASDLEHTTISTDAIGEVDKKDQKPAIDFDQTTVSSETADEIVKKHQEHVTALDHTTISPETVVDLDKKQDAIPNVTEKVSDEVSATSVPTIEIVDRIDHTTESGIALGYTVTPMDAFSETEKEPEAQFPTTAKDTTTGPFIGIEDKIDSTTVSDESSVSIEDEEIIPATSAPVEIPKESVEETSEEEELLSAITDRPEITEELEKKHTLESVTEKIPTSGSAEEISGETTTDKVEMDEDKLEITTAKPETRPQIDEEEISTEKISTLAGISEKPVQITPIKTDEKTETPLTSSEISDKFGSTTDEVEESDASTVATPTKDESKITVSTPSGILDESEEEETTSSEEKEVDLKATAKPFAAEELTTPATLSVSSVQQNEKDIKEETTIGYYETTVSSDIRTSQSTEKTTDRPPITEEVSSENVFDMEKIPIVIPGEGDCLVGQKTYSNNTVVPNSDICEMSCKCISSVVVCQTVKCDIQNMENCIMDDSSKGCCPIFICDGEKIDTTQFPIQASTSTEGIPKEVSEKDVASTTPAKDIDETATFTPTDIDIPAASTEEPMSHVKDEVKEDQEHGTTSILKIDLLPIATETSSVMAQKPVIKPEDTIPHDKLEDKPVTEEPISAHTVAPSLSEKPISGAIEDVTEIETTAPTAEIDEEEIIDETLSHTAAPSLEDEKITETITPSDIDIEKETLSQTTTPATEIKKEADEVTKTQTVSPTVSEKDKVSGKEPLVPITETEDKTKFHVEKEAEDVTEASTLVPSIKDKEKEAVDESLAQTVIPPHDETATAGVNDATTEAYTTPSTVKSDEEETLTYTDAPIAAEDFEITKTQTVSPSVEDKETQTFDVHTTKPFVDGEKDAEDHTVMIEDIEKDVISQTAAPGIELGKETDTITSVPPLKDEEKESINGTSSQSTTPTTEEMDESLAHTIAPIVEDGTPAQIDIDGSEDKAHTVAPSVEDKKKDSTDEEKKPSEVAQSTETPSEKIEEQDTVTDEFAHTLAPTIKKETEDTTEAQTIAPSLAMEDKKPFDETLEHTIAPTVESEMEGEGVTKSTLPSVQGEESLSHTVAPASADKINIDDHNIAPSVETDKQKPVDETLAHTVTPIAHDEIHKEESTDGLEDKIKKPVEESTAHSITSAEEDTESTEDVAKEHFTVSSIKGQEQETATKTTTSTPTTKDKDEESMDESVGHTTDSSTESEEALDAKLDHTDSTLSGTDKRIDEATKTQTVTPISDEEKETKTPSKQEGTEDEVQAQTELPSTAAKENEPTDESLSHTIAPHVEKGETTEDVTKVYTPVTLDEGKEKDKVHEDRTGSPLSGSDKNIGDSTKTQTVTPISVDENETESPSKQNEIEDEDHTDSALSGSDKGIDEAIKTQSVTPISGEEKETKVPPKQEGIEDEDHTDSTLSGSDKDIDESTKTQTVTPISDEEKETKAPSKQEEIEAEDHTDSILSGSDKGIDEATKTQTVSSISDEEKPTKAPSKQEEIEDEVRAQTELPSTAAKDNESGDESLSHTIAPHGEKGETTEDVTKAHSPAKDEVHTEVPSVLTEGEAAIEAELDSAHIDKEESDEEEDESEEDTHTAVPLVDDSDESSTEIDTPLEKGKHEQTVKPSLESEEEFEAVTKAPTVEGVQKEPVDKQTTSAPIKSDMEDKEKEAVDRTSTPASVDESLTHTIAPHVEEDVTEDISKAHTLAPPIKDNEIEVPDEHLGHTSVPEVEKETEDVTKLSTAEPSIKDEDKELDDSLTHVSTPSTEHEKATEASLIQDDKSEDIMKSTKAPSAEDVGQETIDETLASTDVTTSESEEESEEDTKASTIAPSFGTDEKQSIDESLAHTDSPAIIAENITVATTTKQDHTTIPSTEEDHTVSSIEDEEKIDKELPTISPEAEDRKDTEAQKPIPSIEVPEKKPIDESLAHTIVPSSEAEKETAELSKDHTVAPHIEDEEKDFVKHTTVAATETEASTIAPSIKYEGKQPIEESSTHTISPIIGVEKEFEDIAKATTAIPSAADKEKEIIATEDYTVGPVTETDDKEKEIVDTSLGTTIAPSIQDKLETEAHTIVPAVEKETVGITEAHTVAPVGQREEEGTDETVSSTVGTLVEGDKKTAPSVELDESMAQTIAPSAEDEQELDNITKAPLDVTEDDKQQTISPTGEKKPLDESATPVSEIMKTENAVPVKEEKVEAGHTVAPLGSEKESDVGVEDYSVSPLEEDEEKETDHVVTSSVEDEFLPQSTVSTILGEKETEETTTVKGAQKESIDETSEKVESIEPSKEDEVKEPVSQTTASAIESEKETEIVTAASAEGEQSTRAPSVVPSLESVEESEESVESEEELTTEGSGPKIQHIGEFVTERIEEAVTELSQKIDDTFKHDEVEASGEEGEDMEEVEVDVKKIIISSTPKPVGETETPSSIESEEDQTTSKDKDEITDSTQKPLEAVTSVPSDVGIAVTTPGHKITDAVQAAEVQTETNVAEKVTLPPQIQDIPTKIHTGIGITEESATEKTVSLEESQDQKGGDEQKESDEHKTVTESSASEEEAEVDTQATTTSHPLFGQHTTSTYLPPLFDERIDTTANVSETGKEPAALTTTTTTSAPTVQYPNAPSPVYGGQPPQYPSYPEDEYTDEDETEVFGPGTCRYGGKLFVSAQQIPRDDPCDFCFCFRSDIICLQQSCPPPISGCHEEPISGFCCPRYECPVSMATVLNITTSTTTTSTTLPPHFLHHAYQGAAAKNGCHINGKSYQVGEKIDSTSGPCMHCTCGGDGQMKCDPKTCSPEPMLRQMIASVASRRR